MANLIALEVISGLIGILAIGMVSLTRFLWRVDRRQQQHDAMLEHLDECLDRVRQVTAETNVVVMRELRPNGGDSIRDRVIRIEERQPKNE